MFVRRRPVAVGRVEGGEADVEVGFGLVVGEVEFEQGLGGVNREVRVVDEVFVVDVAVDSGGER